MAEALEPRHLMADWVLVATAVAPVRGTERLPTGRLAGVRSTGRAVQLILSTDPGHQGRSWQAFATVVQDDAVRFGDPMLRRAADGTLFCAYRQQDAAGRFRVSVSKSVNGGGAWTPDGDVTPWSDRFVGAPFLSQRADGDLQIYYDSEPAADAGNDAGDQWIAMKQRDGTAGPWDANGTVIAARGADLPALGRDGMPSIVSLGAFGESERLMCVVEGVSGVGSNWNVVRAYQSFDAGRTWDHAGRRTVYQTVRTSGANHYNAYNPYAIRVGNGPVRVAFCTDEAKPGAPDASHAPVDQRFAHVRYVDTTVDFETWGAPRDLYTATSKNYNPGLQEVAPNQVLATIDALDGRVRVLRDPPPDLAAPAATTRALAFSTTPEARFTFDEPLLAGRASAGTLRATNLTTGVTTTISLPRLSSDARGLTFALPPTLADGDYRFTIPAHALSDVYGNVLATATDLAGPDVYLLAGDADRDRRVGFADLTILAQRYGTSGRGYLEGNFDGSADGRVAFADLTILAQRYGTTLAPAPMLVAIRGPVLPRDKRSAARWPDR